MPKYIITTSSDEFFIPDDSHYYFNDLPGEKYLRVLPNAEHELEVFETKFKRLQFLIEILL